MEQVIVIGGGLAGLSAAHTVVERGGRVVVMEKMAFCGGNSTKATSGINGAGTKFQRGLKIEDSSELFEEDTIRGGAKNKDLVRVLCHESGPAVEWLADKFNLNLNLVSRLGGHSAPRTHRSATRFPGMTITYALMERYEELCQKHPDQCRLLLKTRVTKLITNSNNEVVGVEYLSTTDGPAAAVKKEFGSVIIATGGFGYDNTGLIAKYRPDLKDLPTTNGEHTTGDGIKMVMEILGDSATIDLSDVQIHPSGLVDPRDPTARWKFLAAEALRGVGGIILDKEGKRFCNELGRRDYVTGMMWKNKGPFRLVLNGAASKEIEWHCKHYKGRGLMKQMESGEELAKEMGVDVKVLEKTFGEYTAVAKQVTENPEQGPYEGYPKGKTYDVYGKKFFQNWEYKLKDTFHVAIITPVVHYTMGGIKVDPEARVIGGGNVRFLYGAGEVNGGIHGENRLGGSSLLDCVVFGRVAGRTAAKEMLEKNIQTLRTLKLNAKL